MLRIEDKVHISLSCLIFPFNTVSVACGQIDQIHYGGQFNLTIVRKNR